MKSSNISFDYNVVYHADLTLALNDHCFFKEDLDFHHFFFPQKENSISCFVTFYDVTKLNREENRCFRKDLQAKVDNYVEEIYKLGLNPQNYVALKINVGDYDSGNRYIFFAHKKALTGKELHVCLDKAEHDIGLNVVPNLTSLLKVQLNLNLRTRTLPRYINVA